MLIIFIANEQSVVQNELAVNLCDALLYRSAKIDSAYGKASDLPVTIMKVQGWAQSTSRSSEPADLVRVEFLKASLAYYFFLYQQTSKVKQRKIVLGLEESIERLDAILTDSIAERKSLSHSLQTLGHTKNLINLLAASID